MNVYEQFDKQIYQASLRMITLLNTSKQNILKRFQ